jgi:hypothetical protein
MDDCSHRNVAGTCEDCVIILVAIKGVYCVSVIPWNTGGKVYKEEGTNKTI